MSERPLFYAGNIDDQTRTLLCTVYGYSADRAKAIPDGELHPTLLAEEISLMARRRVPQLVAEGFVTREAAGQMSVKEIGDLGRRVDALKTFQSRHGGKIAEVPVPAVTVVELPEFTRGDIMTLFAQTLTIMAAQQAELDELRSQVATLHDANLAIFGQQKVIDQLTNAERDFEGVDVSMTLEEQSSTLDESSVAGSEDSKGAFELAGSASAAIEGMAAQLAGLKGHANVDLTKMNQTAKLMKERSKHRAKVRSKGEVHIKIGKVTGGHSKGGG